MFISTKTKQNISINTQIRYVEQKFREKYINFTNFFFPTTTSQTIFKANVNKLLAISASYITALPRAIKICMPRECLVKSRLLGGGKKSDN